MTRNLNDADVTVTRAIVAGRPVRGTMASVEALGERLANAIKKSPAAMAKLTGKAVAAAAPTRKTDAQRDDDAYYAMFTDEKRPTPVPTPANATAVDLEYWALFPDEDPRRQNGRR